MILRFADGDRMAFLEDFVDCNKGFECLYFVCEDGLSVFLIRCQWENPDIGVIGGRKEKQSYTFIPAQNAAEDLWSQV